MKCEDETYEQKMILCRSIFSHCRKLLFQSPPWVFKLELELSKNKNQNPDLTYAHNDHVDPIPTRGGVAVAQRVVPFSPPTAPFVSLQFCPSSILCNRPKVWNLFFLLSTTKFVPLHDSTPPTRPRLSLRHFVILALTIDCSVPEIDIIVIKLWTDFLRCKRRLSIL